MTKTGRTRTHKGWLKVFPLVLAFFVFLVAGGAVLADEEREDLTRKLELLGHDIKSTIDNRSCESDEQCRILTFGYQPCGGFREALVYSVKNLDENLLWYKSRLYYNIERQLTPWAYGNCGYPIIPDAVCVENICVKEKHPRIEQWEE